MNRMWKALAAVAMAAGLAGCGINAIPTKQEAARARWGDVQSTYQRRADLVPNLVATVQGAAAQERATLNEVIGARARATSVNITADQLTDPAAVAQFEQAQAALSQGLGRLLVTVERYPELRSNQNFLTLQSQLEGIENRINVARRDYNAAVQDYNTELRTFPGSIWASTLHSGNRPMQAFTGTAAAQTAPTVRFDIPPAAGSGAAPAPAPTAPGAFGAPPPVPEAAPPGTVQ